MLDHVQGAYNRFHPRLLACSLMVATDDAFSAESDRTNLLQLRSGKYLLTLSSRGEGGLKPIAVSELEDLAKTAIKKGP